MPALPGFAGTSLSPLACLKEAEAFIMKMELATATITTPEARFSVPADGRCLWGFGLVHAAPAGRRCT